MRIWPKHLNYIEKQNIPKVKKHINEYFIRFPSKALRQYVEHPSVSADQVLPQALMVLEILLVSG